MTGALFLPSLEGGGAERVMLSLAGELPAHGYPVDLVVGRMRGALVSQLPGDVHVVELGHDRLRTALPGLVRYLRTRRPDYLLSTLDHANALSLLARAVSGTGIPVIVRVANTPSEIAAAARSPMQRLTVMLAGRLYRRADALVAVSRGVAADLARFAHVDPSAIRTLPNPVVRSDVLRSAAAPLAHPWLRPGEPPVILAVGSLDRKKNVPLLLEALARIRRARDVRLLVLGDGSERPTIERLVRRLELTRSVQLPGFDANPYRYMARCAVFALASDREGLPGVLIEALACRANIVSTDCRSGPREILHDGRFGRLVPVRDPDAMARALLAALDDPVTPPAESWAPYTLERATAAYVGLIRRLAA